MTELSPDAKALLRRARTEFSPGENRLAKVRSALDAQMAASPADLGASKTAPRSTGAPPAPAASLTWGIGHSIGTAVLIGALGAAGFAAWRTGTSNVAVTHVQPTSGRALPPPSPTQGPPQDENQAEKRGEAPRPSDHPTPLLAETRGQSAAPTPLGRTQGRPRSKTDVPHESPADPSVTTLPAPPVMIPPQATPITTAPRAPPPAAEAVDSLAEEVRLLRDARAALDRSDPSRALGFLDVHASRFPRGTLYEERLATRVLACCALGRVDAARLAAQELERAAPQSPHLGRVRASCIAAPATP